MNTKKYTKQTYNISAALWALTISAFAIGTTEFVIVGLVKTLANDLQVSIADAGSLVSMYAAGVAIGVPVLTALTSKMKRKPLMICLMVLFIIGHLASAFAPSYHLLLISRFITGFAHGVFFGVGATIAASLVPTDKRASAIAMMFSGFTIATIVGVPLGTFIGQQWGWRATFVGVAILGVVGLIGVAALLPNNIAGNRQKNIFKQTRILFNTRFIIALLMTIFGYGGVFVAFTYMSPILQEITGFSANEVSIFLLVYGIAVAFGNFIGGKVANKNPFRAMVWILIFQTLVLAALFITEQLPAPALITLFILGGLSFATVPASQLLIVQIAEQELPEAVDFASSLNISGFNLGIALGAWTGGIVATSSLGLSYTPLAGAAFVVIAMIFCSLYNVIRNSKKFKEIQINSSNIYR